MQEVWKMLDKKIAVIDTETTWYNNLMSIGVAVADSKSYKLVDKKYYIIDSNIEERGMYYNSLYINNIVPDNKCSKKQALDEISVFLKQLDIDNIFAYNALFDYGQLPELRDFKWHDIMKIAAYKQFNKKIPETEDCFKTGRLKKHFGVESIYRILSDDYFYFETHNAIFDAIDELKIMEMLDVPITYYKEISSMHK